MTEPEGVEPDEGDVAPLLRPTDIDPGRERLRPEASGGSPRPTTLDPGRGPAQPQAPRATTVDPGRGPAQPQAPRATTVDPGRGSPQPQAPRGTTLDPGREGSGAPPAPPMTTLDPGRAAPAGDREPSAVGLPRQLADRFDVVNEQVPRGAEATVYVVRERTTFAIRVLKLYESVARRPDQRIWDYLRGGRVARSVVETLEVGVVDGRCYELMEYLAGDDLLELRAKCTLEELGTDGMRSIIAQLVTALEELHGNGIAHRDVKPANIRLRSFDPLEVVLLDFGISSVVGEGDRVDDTSGTPPYTPPEFLSARWVTPKTDWWALGITLMEFIANATFLGDLDDVGLRSRITAGAIDTSAVTDPDLRRLCRGLTAQAERSRWGAAEVREWLAGGSPPLPDSGERQAERQGGAERPYRYLDQEYRFPDDLAVAMTTTWEMAASVFYGGDAAPRKQLWEWATQFPDIRLPPGNRRLERLRGRPDPPDVRLLRLVRALRPTAPPVYRNVNIAVDRLSELARSALEDAGNTRAIVDELWDHDDLLLLLSRGGADAGLSSGDGLVERQGRWRAESRRLDELGRILSGDARAEFERMTRDERARLRALALYAVTATDEQRTEAARQVELCARWVREAEVEVAWFDQLARRVDALWLAFLLVPFARATAERLAYQAEQERLEREWLRRTQALREWSRRQNRPQALAWGVAGVVALATVWVALIAVSDMVGLASDATILDAWLAAVCALLVVLTAESLLAWQIGGGFHPRYGIVGAGVIALGRAARSVAGRGIGLFVLLGVVGGPVLIGIVAPVIVPLASGALVVVWGWLRFLRWQTDRAREQERIEQAERERQAVAT